jgi:hypothetical protein
MALEDIIKSIGDEAERGQFTALLDKYGSVKATLELGDQVKPAFDKLTGMGLPAAAELARIPEWVKYRQDHWVKERNMWDTQVAAVDEAATLRARVVELEATTGGDVTIEQLKAEVEKLGYVKKDDLTTNLKLVDGKTLLDSMNAQGKRFEEIYSALTPLTVGHTQKYGEPIPIGEVMEHMNKSGERDPLKAYQAVIAPRDTNLKIKQLEADGVKKFEEGKQKGIEEAQARVNAQRMPVDGGGSQKRPHFMQRIFAKRETAQAQSNGRLGSGSAAQAGFADYTKKAMGGASV